MRLVNVKDLYKAGVALELTEFQTIVSRHIDAAKECLKTKWFPKVQEIFMLVSSELIFSAGCLDSQGLLLLLYLYVILYYIIVLLYSLYVITGVRLFKFYSDR
jgi:hypothetical protein